MNILNLHIGAFGKFKDFDLAPAEGLNLYCHANEYGKTTLIYFIYYMLYGYDAKLLKKYLPWSGEDLSGRLEFALEGRRWRIERHRPAKGMEKRSIHCLDTGEERVLSNKEQPGPYFLGLDGETFLRSFCITQGDLLFDRTDGLDVALKNMAATGDENVSYHQAEEYLNKLHTQYKHRTRNSGHLVEQKEALARGKEEQERLRAAVDARLAERKQWEELQGALAQKEQEMEALAAGCKAAEGSDALKLLRRLDALKELPRAEKPAIAKEDLAALEQAFDAAERTQGELRLAEEAAALAQRELNSLGAPQTGLWPMVLLVAGVAAGIVGAALTFWPCYIVAAGLLIGALIVYLIKSSEHRDTRLILQSKVTSEQATCAMAKSAHLLAQDTLERLRQTHRIFSVQEVRELQIAWGVYEKATAGAAIDLQEQAILAGRTRAELEALAQDAVETEQTGEQARAMLRQAQAEREALRQRKEALDHRDLQMLWDRLAECTEANLALERQIAEGEARLAAIQQTLLWLKEANEEMNTHFAPKLCQRAGEYLSALTAGRYSGLLMDDSFAIKLESSLGTHAAEHYSAGTRDAIYFSFRLAAGEMLGKEPLPMVLDDPFTNLDDTRKKAAMDLLARAAKERQILYFSCHRVDEKTPFQNGVQV